jgi:tellurite resistance protein TehA-like permease
MEKNDLFVIVLISVIAIVLAGLIIPIMVKTPQPGAGQNPAGPTQANPDQRPPPPPGQEESKQLKIAVSFINIGLIIPLFVIYAGIYRKIRTSFTLGLIAVIFALGMYAVMSNPLLISLLGGRAEHIGLFEIIPDLCATVALIILVRISLE